MKKLFALLVFVSFSMNAMDAKNELVQAGAIVAGGAATAYVFSNGAEWISQGIAPKSTEEFNLSRDYRGRNRSSINKWGLLGTLWVGVPLAIVARFGSHPLPAQDLVKPLVITYGATAGASVLAGIYKYVQVNDSEKAGRRAAITARFMSFLAAPAGLVGYVLYKRIKG